MAALNKHGTELMRITKTSDGVETTRAYMSDGKILEKKKHAARDGMRAFSDGWKLYGAVATATAYLTLSDADRVRLVVERTADRAALLLGTKVAETTWQEVYAQEWRLVSVAANVRDAASGHKTCVTCAAAGMTSRATTTMKVPGKANEFEALCDACADQAKLLAD